MRDSLNPWATQVTGLRQHAKSHASAASIPGLKLRLSGPPPHLSNREKAEKTSQKILPDGPTSVTAITEPPGVMRDTQVVNMVRRTRKRFSLSRATRSSSGKGKPRLASFHKGSPVAARYRPPASATGPAFILVSTTGASEAKTSFGGVFLFASEPGISRVQTLAGNELLRYSVPLACPCSPEPLLGVIPLPVTVR